MNLWQRFELGKTQYKSEGISFHYEKGIEKALRRKYMSFARWLRKKYVFPTHVHVHILNCEKIRLQSGAMAYGSFRWFERRNPMIRIPSAIESELLEEYTKEEIYEQILSSLVHELTHYYQWVLDLEQSNAASERQANYYRYRMLEAFNKSLNH